VAKRAPKKRKLTTDLLRGPQTTAQLERLTGVPKDSIRYRRERLGIVRDERVAADRTWVPHVRPRLGKLPDADLARLVGKSGGHVSDVRAKLGIEAAPTPSLAASERMRAQLKRAPKATLRAALAELDPVDRTIVRERYLRPRPITLAVIGKRLGVSRQRVAQRERRAIGQMLARLTSR
jgi:RNA polymerase sigma factor (sigma-70 family)